MAIQRIRCPLCGLLSVRAEDDRSPFRCPWPECGQDAPEQFEREEQRKEQGLSIADIAAYRYQQLGAAIFKDPRMDGWVYYVRFGDRIKIGTTRNLKKRLSVLPHDELLAVEPGSQIVEHERHQQFRADRVEGHRHREWFHDTSTLREHVAAIREKHGDPQLIVAQEVA